jgi:hypothetical protein
VKLGQSVDGLGQIAGSRVRLPIKLRVNPGVPQSKIGAEIDYPASRFNQWNRKLGSQPVRESEEKKLRV